jgi:hypothetical protein
VSLHGAEVRTLGPADELRLLCLHFLHHGGWRPLWLCDVAAAVEARPIDFSWDLCLGSDPTTANWVACTVALARDLLGAELGDVPPQLRARNPPRWLTSAVLTSWEKPDPWEHPPLSYGRPLADYGPHPMKLVTALRKRWPDPITATVSLRRPFNAWPRLPFQIAHCLQRGVRLLSSPSRV